MDTKKNKEYVNIKVNPILIPMLKEIMIKRPKNCHQFMTSWIENFIEKKKHSNKKIIEDM